MRSKVNPSDIGGMHCQVVFPHDLTREQTEWFWDQGVNMDDWDVMVLAPASTLKKEEVKADWSMFENITIVKWVQTNWHLESLVRGVCNETWYLVEFKDGPMAVGVAYHG